MKKILILTACAVFLAACGTSNEVKNTAVANAPAANSPANAPAKSEPIKQETYTAGVNPRADLISATQKLQKLPFWSAVVTSTANLDLKIEMEYSAPDRWHIKKTDGEIIVIGAETYSNESGKWKKNDEDLGESIREQIANGINEGVKTMGDVKIVGKEKFNGQDATVYSHEADGATIRVWIASDSGLQLKNEVSIDDETNGKLTQATVYDYQKQIKIEAPKLN